MLSHQGENAGHRLILPFVLVALGLYVFPVLASVPEVSKSIGALPEADNLWAPLWRSICFSIGSGFFIVTVSLIAALQLRQIRPSSLAGLLLNLLLLPFLLGDTSVAMMGKLLFTDVAFFNGSRAGYYLGLFFIQFFHYGTLFIYLFYLLIQAVPRKELIYSESIKHSSGERNRDVYLPSLRNTAFLLFLLTVILSFFEQVKSTIVFKASHGTYTELVGQFTQRNYFKYMGLGLDSAVDLTLPICLVLSMVLLVVAGFGSLLFRKGYDKCIQQRQFGLFPEGGAAVSYAVLVGALTLVATPILGTLSYLDFGEEVNLLSFKRTFGFTFFASCVCTVVCIVVATVFRWVYSRILHSINKGSTYVIITLFVVQLFPPIALMLAGYKWLSVIGVQTDTANIIVWVIGHLVLVFGVLTSFALVTHFVLENREIEYLKIYKHTRLEVFKVSFWGRFKINYLFLFLFSFSLVWNESVINGLFSEFIPSFVTMMKSSISGRGADFQTALVYFVTSLLVSLLAIFVWFISSIKTAQR